LTAKAAMHIIDVTTLGEEGMMYGGQIVLG
jgi:hypothetical protein